MVALPRKGLVWGTKEDGGEETSGRGGGTLTARWSAVSLTEASEVDAARGARLMMWPSGTGRGKTASGSDNADGPGVGVECLCSRVRMIGRERTGRGSRMGFCGGGICPTWGGQVGRGPNAS